MSTLINVNNLSRLYGDFYAVNDISFSLKAGDILGFLGPNGAGKSSTMKMLSGNLAPSAGAIELNGYSLLSHPKQAKLSLGYLSETPPLYEALTVSEYLIYCAKLRKVKNNNIKNACNTAMEHCGLTQVANQLIKNLSKGYRQRAGIAQAIIHSPAVIILDEPTVGLDPLQMREIRQLIKTLGQTHSIILCSHLLGEVQAVCNQIKIIHQGKIVYSANDAELSNEDKNAYDIILSDKVTTQILKQHNIFTQVVSQKNQTEHKSQFIIHSQSSAQQLLAYIVKQDWGLCHFSQHKNSLEKTFIQLTST